ncbi:MAG: bifunctional precorrin-2 dehydrogenase/sirohydrochlorin ferrochelatase [Nitrospirae bacterium]|nr:bifunctional precorrin-2 dehydrogenase/sirohydrochlorin ferrochelatase [Nitrospirota bacterium]
MIKYYPVCLKLEGKKCVVVGGGRVAERKVASLLSCGALVQVISPVLTSRLSQLVKKGRIEHVKDDYKPKFLSGSLIVIAATDDEKINNRIASQAGKRGILVNVVDSPEECTFIVPASLKRGDLSISIFTNGLSPALSGKIRQQLEEKYGREYGEFLKIMARLRPKVLREVRDPRKRKQIFRSLVESDILELIRKGKRKEIQEKIKNIIKCSSYENRKV